MAEVLTNGAMVASIRATGVAIECMDMASSLGMTAVSTKDNTPTIKKMALEYSAGRMDDPTKVAG